MQQKRNWSIYSGSIIAAAFIIIALLSLLWTPYDATFVDIPKRLRPPSLSHWFGTDQYGRDILSMAMIGTRISIIVGLLAVTISLLIGSAFGLLAAALPRYFEGPVMRTSDLLFAFPALIIAILVAAVFGPGAYTVIIAVAIFNIPVFARIARAAALPLWESGFCLAAQTFGKSRLRISVEHILPNTLPVLLTQASIQYSLALLAEAGLSYVGLGVQPPTPSLGRMLAEGQTYAATAAWLTLIPGLLLFLIILGVNLLGEGLREKFDPRAAGRTP